MEIKDEFLSQSIYTIFHEMPALGHCPIRAVCRNGVVYLRGKIDTAEHRHMAESLVGTLPGVRNVVNQLSYFSDEEEIVPEQFR